MPVAEILREIDAHISCLRAARELLAAPWPKVQPARARRKNGKVKATKKTSGSAIKPVIQTNKSRSNRVIIQSERANKPVESVVPPVGAFAPSTLDSNQRPIVVKEPSLQQTADRAVPTPRKPRRVKESVHRIIHQPSSRSKPASVKPAVALAGSVSSRIVVVSAEQARQEREKNRAAQSVVPRPRVPASGLSGRLAFEALFKDATDPSKSSD